MGAAIIIATMILLSTIYVDDPPPSQVYNVAYDIINVFSSMRVGEVTDEYSQELITNGTIPSANLEKTIIEQLTIFWLDNEDDYAENFAMNQLDKIIPEIYNVGVYIESEKIYESNNIVSNQTLVVAKQPVSIITTEPSTGLTKMEGPFMAEVRVYQ